MAENETTLVALPPVVDLDALDAVRDRLLEAVDTGPVTVSAQGVERVATNALFMLMSAAQTARRNGHGFRISSISSPLLTAIERLGLGEQFAALSRGQG